MSQYRKGQFVSTGAAVTIPLGFIPSKFSLLNYTKTAAGTGVGYSEWVNGVVPSGSAIISTYTAGAPVVTVSANGYTPVVLGGDWYNTNYVITDITKANPGVVTVSSLTPTNSMTLTNGMTFTISSVIGMTQVNQNRYVVAQLGVPSSSATKFYLYDTFGNPVDTTAFGTYSSGGIMDVISYPPTAPVLNPVNGQVLTPGSPAGLQYDIGYQGLTLGSAIYGTAADVMFWECWYETPTGY